MSDHFLERMNAALSETESIYLPKDPPELPLIFVLGAPRSGTTLMTQLIARHLDVGFVNHLAAVFWDAPVQGLMLARKLLPRRATGDYESAFGQTLNITDPHEFGRFWRHRLGYDDMVEQGRDHEASIDWAHLQRTLYGMIQVVGRPMLFKPFLLVWHLNRALAELPNTVVVRMRREPADVAASLLAFRRRRFGDEHAWASLVPRGADHFADASPTEQVVFQIREVEDRIERGLAGHPHELVVDVPYERLCAEPLQALQRITTALKSCGSQCDVIEPPPDSFTVRHPFTEATPGRQEELRDSFARLLPTR